jgi:hypothetical protein
MSVINVRKKELNKNGYNDFEHWNANLNHLYIGRNMCAYVPGTIGSKWKNPFSLKQFTLEVSLEKYEDHIRNTPALYNSLYELEGKVLGCWCKPSQCHGDILLKLLAEK